MGHKVHPRGFRLAVTRGWDSVWFSQKNYQALLKEDVQIRALLMKELKDALVDRIEIQRSRGDVTINIYSAKPGVIIGRSGSGIEELNKKLKKNFYRGKRTNVRINVKEVKNPALSSRIVALQIAGDIERRMPFRRSMKQARDRVMKAGAHGIKITVGGRLNGADIARSESVSQGKVPLHTLRADVDYSHVMARTVYGAIGVRVWINRGEVFEQENN